MRRGKYAKYKGREYEAYTEDRKVIELTSYNDEEIEGFSKSKTRLGNIIYVKKVDVTDLEDAYEINLLAVYRGEKLPIIGFNEGTGIVYVLLKNEEHAKMLGLEYTREGLHEWVAKVSTDELEIVERKDSIWGF